MSTCDDCCTNVFCSCYTCLLTRLVYLYVSGASFYYVLALFSLSLSMILFTVAFNSCIFSYMINFKWILCLLVICNCSCFYLMIFSYLLFYRDHRVYSQIAFCDIVMDSVWQFDGSDMNCVLNKMLLNINVYI